MSTAARTTNPLQATHRQASNTSLAFIVWAMLMVLIGKGHHTIIERTIAWLMVLSPAIVTITTQLYFS